MKLTFIHIYKSELSKRRSLWCFKTLGVVSFEMAAGIFGQTNQNVRTWILDATDEFAEETKQLSNIGYIFKKSLSKTPNICFSNIISFQLLLMSVCFRCPAALPGALAAPTRLPSRSVVIVTGPGPSPAVGVTLQD